jgi:hypothetical protein
VQERYTFGSTNKKNNNNNKQLKTLNTMKKILLTLTLITIGLVNSHAQNTEPNGNATWVIESTAKNARTQTVNFYDNTSKLIYSETISAHLNINRKKVQKALNQILDSLLAQDSYRNNKNVLAASFKVKN